MVSSYAKAYADAKRDILDESAHLEARLRAMYLIKNDGKTYKNAKILMEAATKTDSVLLEHELYYNLGQFQLTGKPRRNQKENTETKAKSDQGVTEGDDIVRFLMQIISSQKPKHDSISRHEALEALGAIFANPFKGLSIAGGRAAAKTVTAADEGEDAKATTTSSSSADPTTTATSLRAEVDAFLDDLTQNERILSVRQSAELARDRLRHANATAEQYKARQANIKARWLKCQRVGGDGDDESSSDEDNDDDVTCSDDDDCDVYFDNELKSQLKNATTPEENKAARQAIRNAKSLTFETKWVCPSQVHSYLSVDPSPAFDEEEDDATLASYKRYQNADKALARVMALGRIMRNEKEKKTESEKEEEAAEATSATESPQPEEANYNLFDRYRAMFSLRNICSPEAIEILSDALISDKSSALLRHEIAFVLGQIEKNSCEKALIECLMNVKEAGMVRHEAAIAIGGIAQPKGLEALEQNVNDRDQIVKDSCVAGLEMHRYWSDFSENIRRAQAERAKEEEEAVAAAAAKNKE